MRDNAGNLLAIGATSMILIMSLIGSGIDISRAYLTKTSLQNACDSGVLAGRRALNRTGVYEANEIAKANKMFNFNLDAERVSADDILFASVANADGEVTGTASATLPTVVMNMFGFPQFALSVDCSAELHLSSSDIMFVLDTTGSMNCDPGVVCGSSTESTNAKIRGLRAAVRDFYTTVAGAVRNKTETRIRFGFVPYSMTVNVRPLVTSGVIAQDHLTSTTPYQSRLARFNGTPQHNANTPTAAAPTVQTYSSNITRGNCETNSDRYANNRFPSSSGTNPTFGGGPAPTATTSTAYSFNSWTLASGSGSSALGVCRRNATVTTTTYTTFLRFSGYRYIRTNLNTSTFKNSGTIRLASGLTTSSLIPAAGNSPATYYNLQDLAAMTGTIGITNTSYLWSGCIEERGTVVDLAMDPVPADATDLDINSAPNSELTKWRPSFATPVFLRGANAISVDTGPAATSGYTRQTEYCPSPLRVFEEVDLTDPLTVPIWLNTYLNGLIARGGTYHDLGMIWGGRVGSPQGINEVNVNADDLPSVSRHIIFMTDGDMAPETELYSAYGLERYDNRVAPAGTTRTALIAYHNSRFLAACRAAKAEGYTIWVVAFGTALSQNLRDCSSADRAYLANNTVELTAAFRFIAAQVADLRLNQ